MSEDNENLKATIFHAEAEMKKLKHDLERRLQEGSLAIASFVTLLISLCIANTVISNLKKNTTSQEYEESSNCSGLPSNLSLGSLL